MHSFVIMVQTGLWLFWSLGAGQFSIGGQSLDDNSTCGTCGSDSFAKYR